VDYRASLRLSGGEDVYGGARHVERLRRDDGKDEVEKQRRSGRGQPQRHTGGGKGGRGRSGGGGDT
jgi:hypothetical protein